MRGRHPKLVDPTALALLGLAFFTFAVFGILYLANLGEPNLLLEQPWLIIDLTFGSLAFPWGFVILLTDYPKVRTVSFGILTAVSCVVAPIMLLAAAAVVRAGGGD